MVKKQKKSVTFSKKAYTVMKTFKGGIFMKIVLLRTPSFLSPIIKKIFDMNSQQQKNSKKKNQGNAKK